MCITHIVFLLQSDTKIWRKHITVATFSLHPCMFCCVLTVVTRKEMCFFCCFLFFTDILYFKLISSNCICSSASLWQCDRLAADTAVELKSRGVVSVSLWPGAVQTELISKLVIEKDIPAAPGINSKVKQPNKQMSIYSKYVFLRGQALKSHYRKCIFPLLPHIVQRSFCKWRDNRVKWQMHCWVGQR